LEPVKVEIAIVDRKDGRLVWNQSMILTEKFLSMSVADLELEDDLIVLVTAERLKVTKAKLEELINADS